MAHQALTQDMTDEEFDRHIIGILARENWAPVALPDTLSLHRSGPGDYTAERQQWVDHLTLDEIEQRPSRDVEAVAQPS